MEFRDRLISELTQLDQRESKRERHPNIYRLGIYLMAADNVLADIADGSSPEYAFAGYFTPTRGMHTVAKRLGLDLDVDHGEWITGSAK